MDALFQYPPRPLVPERFPKPRCKDRHLPTIAIVTPSFMQGNYLERTMRSVLDQNYPHLRYAVQDAGSTDATPDILRRYAPRLAAWTSAPDTGQARAILTGFQKVHGDIMAWLNSDDLLMPGALRFVGEFFSRHPHVDALYGHRVIIDEEDREVGRWVLPRFDARTLRWIDYVPQETLF
ncbi:MAG: glycosyltransferase, partial [Rubrivivax sp.]|nr:glycosyltransferase [Rubrivivax sp.]